MAKKVVKKKQPVSDRTVWTLRLVTSDVCERCKSQCARGIRYMTAMREPGAVGRGVPCILTRVKK
ncbi:hypothetical protein [Paenibacillus sp. J31TS4]|uniref:hypothetical protein n=1 Tax=Paenibacillus sp. J31TS4 TaxID=2807195 RepID=UPI001BD00348|nr:hypothetical protein [Paenibacillus sp. J31TS4]